MTHYFPAHLVHFDHRLLFLPAVSEASAEATASSYVDCYRKGHKGRKPSFIECVAAASAESSAFAFGGGEAFSYAQAVAQAATKNKGWKGKFISECRAQASATAISFGADASASKALRYAAVRLLAQACAHQNAVSGSLLSQAAAAAAAIGRQLNA